MQRVPTHKQVSEFVDAARDELNAALELYEALLGDTYLQTKAGDGSGSKSPGQHSDPTAQLAVNRSDARREIAHLGSLLIRASKDIILAARRLESLAGPAEIGRVDLPLLPKRELAALREAQQRRRARGEE